MLRSRCHWDESYSVISDSVPHLLDAALDYARRGWPVFPVAPRGKLPLIAKRDGGNGLHDATTNADVIAGWWTRWPEANIGLRTGVVFDVLDIDGQEGFDALNAFRADRPITWGPEARTGGGGWHLFHLPCGAGNRAGLVPHVDYRGKGGYVVAPPSVHPSGLAYAWASDLVGPDEPLEPLPSWLLELVVPPVPPPGSRAGPSPSLRHLDAYAQRALDAELGRVALAAVGNRNHQLNRSAFALGQLVAAGALPLEVVVAGLLEAAARAGLIGSEVEATIASGLRSGAREPRRLSA